MLQLHKDCNYLSKNASAEVCHEVQVAAGICIHDSEDSAHLGKSASAEMRSEVEVTTGVHKDRLMVAPERPHRRGRNGGVWQGTPPHGDTLAEKRRLLQRIEHRTHDLQRLHGVHLRSCTVTASGIL